MDENRQWKVYAAVYYAVKAICLLFAGLFLVTVCTMLSWNLPWSGQTDADPVKVGVDILILLIQTGFIAVSGIVLVKVIGNLRERGRQSAGVMAFVLAFMTYACLTTLLRQILPPPDRSAGVSMARELPQVFGPLLAAWVVYLLSRAVLVVVANRSQRLAPGGEGTGG